MNIGPAVSRMVRCLIIAGTCGGLLTLLPSSNFLFEINRNCGHYYAIFHLMVIVYSAFFSLVPGSPLIRKCFVLINGALLARAALVLAPFYMAVPAQDIGDSAPGERSLSVYYANINGSNRSRDALLQQVRDHQPDLILLLEFSEYWKRALELPEYPHQLLMPREDNFGLAVFSRFPFQGDPNVELGFGLPPFAEFDLLVGEREMLRVVLLHLYPPVFAESLRRSTVMLRRALGPLRDYEGPVLMAGDFNATPFSPLYKRVIRHGEFHDSRAGRGLERTWFVSSALMRFTIDHLFLRGNITLLDYKRLRPVGSDHFPLFARYRVG